MFWFDCGRWILRLERDRARREALHVLLTAVVQVPVPRHREETVEATVVAIGATDLARGFADAPVVRHHPELLSPVLSLEDRCDHRIGVESARRAFTISRPRTAEAYTLLPDQRHWTGT